MGSGPFILVSFIGRHLTLHFNGRVSTHDTAAKRLRMRSLRPFPVSSLCCSFSFGVLSNCPGTEFVGMALKSCMRRKIHPRVFPFSKKTCHFTLLFCRGRKRNVPECVTHVQSHCFAHYSLLFFDVLVAVAVVVA